MSTIEPTQTKPAEEAVSAKARLRRYRWWEWFDALELLTYVLFLFLE